MKILIPALLLSISLCVAAQYKVLSGSYRNYFGDRIQLNAYSTFKYTWHFDLSYSWSKGTWALKNDTVFFHMVPTYDTLSNLNGNHLIVDTLILSADEISQRIKPVQYPIEALSSGGQNYMTAPDKLLWKKGRLYNIKHGSLVTEKQKGFWTGKKWVPWYFKSPD